MKQEKTITVNGQTYDTATGLPVPSSTKTAPAPTTKKATPSVTSATTLHSATQRSRTLRRTTATKPQPKKTTPAAVAQPKTALASDILPRRRPGRQLTDIARHPQVSRTSANTSSMMTKKPTATAPLAAKKDVSPRQHPHAVRTEQRLSQKKNMMGGNQQKSSLSAKQVKDIEITKALASKSTKTEKTPRARLKRSKTFKIGVISASIAVALIILLWINLPSISIALASVQSGVNADYPHYTPEGYRLQLPIEAKDNQLSMTFASNQNQDSSFLLSQEKSSWDSEAVRAMVEEQSKGQFLTTQDRGLTVYTYSGNAAWVNKGILYKISSNSALSNDTIKRIASSL